LGQRISQMFLNGFKWVCLKCRMLQYLNGEEENTVISTPGILCSLEKVLIHQFFSLTSPIC
jgi:hypothetical protein